MSKKPLSLTFHSKVRTPIGIGTVQGLFKTPDEVDILVSYNPHENPNLPKEVLDCWKGGPWVLWRHPVSDLVVLSS